MDQIKVKATLRFAHSEVKCYFVLSKLRLDYLMSRNISLRDQFASLSHIGTPDLTRGQEIDKLKVVCHPREGRNKEEKWEEMAKLLAGLSLGRADSMAPVNNTPQPLLENTKLLVNTDILRYVCDMTSMVSLPVGVIIACITVQESKQRWRNCWTCLTLPSAFA